MASYLSTRACSAVRIAATRGWFTRTGRTQKAPVAYWNKRHVEPMPGSIIYVGLADSVWSETPDALNADILQTLTSGYPNNEKKTSA
ncbi:capsule biosynthesis GfcC family protein [Shigella sonnei]